jgi:hypothetical protein
MIVEMQLIKTVRITRQYDVTKPIITPAADYSLVGCNTAWPTISAPWTDNCGVGGAKSGNIDGVAEQYKLVQPMVVLNIEITLLMQQMIVEQLIKKTATHHSTIRR